MRSRTPLLCCLTLALGVPLAGFDARQEAGKLADRVTALETEVALQREELAIAHEDLAALLSFQQAVIDGTKELAQSVLESRKNGFEWAGPNPQSKTDLLEGLNSFGRRVRGEPDPEPSDDESGRNEKVTPPKNG